MNDTLIEPDYPTDPYCNIEEDSDIWLQWYLYNETVMSMPADDDLFPPSLLVCVEDELTDGSDTEDDDFDYC